MEQLFFQFFSSLLLLMGFFLILIESFESSNVIQAHLMVNLLSFVLIVFDFGLEGALLHLSVLYFSLVVFSLLLYLPFYVV